MKAAYIKEPGPPENIVYGELPEPKPSGAQVLVRVGAVAVNPIDTYVRAGLVKFDLPLPFVVGCDLAGVVEAAGPEARRYKPGDRVWGSNQGLLGRQGAFAELVAVDEQWLYPTPPGVPDETAAAGALVGITAQMGLVREARLRAGETIFVNGGSGGVGSTVIQMARALGARVIAASGSPEKAEACRQIGAEAVINYRTEDLGAALKQLAPKGVDVWWETTREANFDLAVPALAFRGRMIVMAGRDARPAFPIGPFYTRDAKLLGFVMFLATPEEQQAAAADINRWLAGGQYRPRIDRVLPLSETAQAHRLQEGSTITGKSTVSGKIVLKP
jgi:NADPH2:quinone reductase